MKKLLVALCAGAVILTACSSEAEPSVQVKHHAVKHVKHGKKHASGVNCNK